MESLNGYEPVFKVLQQHGYLGNPRKRLNIVRLWMKQLVEALATMHKHNILLRSLNANNLYVSPDGSKLKIASLHESGILCPVSATEMLISGRLIAGADLNKQRGGKPLTKDPYIPPEQFTSNMLSNEVGPKTKAYIKTLINAISGPLPIF